MKSVGKTYLIKIEPETTEYAGNILLPQMSAISKTTYYIGRIYDYGIAFTEEEIKDLIPIGTKVIMDWKAGMHSADCQDGKIRLIFGEEQFYIYNPEDILAIIEEPEESEEKGE